MVLFDIVLIISNKILSNQEKKSKHNDKYLIENLLKTQKEVKIIENYLINGKLTDYGHLMKEHWIRKKERSNLISNRHIDKIYEYALKNGAIGGKLVGAGGGGFLLFYAEQHEKLRTAMRKKEIIELRFSFDFEGTKNLFVKY